MIGDFTGNVTIGGMTMPTSAASQDIFLAIVITGLELDGALAWTRRVGGTGSLVLGLGGLSVDPTGALIAVALDASGELTVDGQALTLGTTDGAVLSVAVPPDQPS